ncbi:indole-3-acetate O-methyltransferase 1 [Phoenix dactylifera]|uniref:Indole-3-acetate O-methyltransferase 1 n=1 Tax=Phoenix dactylifera TaxID=42345 RepID=A0A8B7BPW5_PHODC|nr:indole-3-acetate O-methyltransferase 1 [Phoenix dactylifera]
MALNGDSVVVPQMKLERMFSMRGGKGEGSYVKNSQAQARHARSLLHFLKETLNSMQLPPSSADTSFTIADLGCSCGPNALFNMDIIVKHVTEIYDAVGREAPEFLVYLSDLPSNDFNTLFQLLPPLTSNSPEESLAAIDEQQRSYYAAGVPGSFFGRLFPARSIHVFHSTFSLHWLSQVPARVTDKQSAAHNKGRIFIHGAPKCTTDAYRDQFKADLTGFLQCRAKEMKDGGVMFLAFLGRTSVDPTDQGGPGILFGTHFQDAWDDLVQEGLLESEKRDSFNIPVYAASLQEFREVVEANGSFAINKLEVVKGGSPLVVSHPEDAAEISRALANSCRSVSGVLVDEHIGEELSEELFIRVERRAVKHAKELMEQLQFFHIVASLSLA